MAILAEITKDAVALEDDVKAFSKVAQLSFAFWVMKICATTVGETAGDMFSMTLNIGYAASSILLISFFVATLILQMRAKSFHPFLYWSVILSTSTAGTTMSDFMDRTLALGYATGSLILVSLLVAILVIWRLSLGSLSVTRIRDSRVEIFYWLAILASNTLGTALGDYLADSSGFGYAMSNLLISGAIAAIALAYYFTSISRTALFWGAFVLTRPFGATMGDLLTKAPVKGGMGIGTYGATAVLMSVLIGLILLTMRSERRPRLAAIPVRIKP